MRYIGVYECGPSAPWTGILKRRTPIDSYEFSRDTSSDKVIYVA